MSSPHDTPPPELAGLNPQDLLRAGLEPVDPAPAPADPDVTVPLSPSQLTAHTQVRQPDLPLPEELTALLPGGAYQVEGFLGQGGMGAVYKGTQIRLRRPVAIKIMRRDLGKDYDFEARFEREAQAMAKLNHPNIVSVIDFGEAGPDYLYIVMELVDGADLMDVIRGGQMTQEMALTLLPQICDALQFAHEHGIIHRDIKPSNIMLTRDGRIKMADFGLAKRFDAESTLHTKTGTGMGTPDYAAPEQFDPGAQIDHRADIYALGVMIYQMITGTLPRGAWKSPSERAPVAPQWDGIVTRAMQSDPADRYQHASEVKTDVSSIPLAGAAHHSARLSQASTPARKSPKTRTAQLAAALIIGAVLAGIGLFLTSNKPDPRASATGVKRADAPSASPEKETLSSTPPRSLSPTLFPPGQWVRPWQSAAEVAGRPLSLVDGWLMRNRDVTPGGTLLFPAQWRDCAIRCEWKWAGYQHGGHLSLRQTNGQRYQLLRDKTAIRLVRLNEDRTTVVLKELPVSEPAEGQLYTLELRAIGSTLTVLLDGKEVIRAQDDKITSGSPAIYLFGDGRARNVELLNLDVPQRASAAVTSTGWTNLIPLIQPQRDSVRGQWMVNERGLHVKPAEWAFCKIPAQDPGTDYDLRFKVTRGEGSPVAMFFAFRKGRSGGYIPIDYLNSQAPAFADGLRWATIQNLTDKNVFHPDTIKAKRQQWLPRGKQCEVLLQVREKEVIVSVNDEEAFRWPADWSKIQQRGGAGEALFAGMTEEPVFGVGIFNCEAVFHSIEMLSHDSSAAVAAARSTASASKSSPAPSSQAGWNPLLGLQEWNDPRTPGVENIGGVLHLKNSASALTRPQPGLDGGVRTRISIREGTESPGVVMRASKTLGHYRATLAGNGKGIFLYYSAPSAAKAEVLGSYDLPAPVQTGQKIELALTAAGRHLTVLLDGRTVIQADDDRCHQPGEHGIIANEGWFENLETLTPPSTGTAEKNPVFTNTLGMKFVPVPGTDVLMCAHETRRKDYEAFASTLPGVDQFWKTPLYDDKPLLQEDDHPVVSVCWTDARAFADWLSRKEGKRYRLPTEKEWNLAVVTGLQNPESASPQEVTRMLENQYPWGTENLSDADRLGNYKGAQDGYEGTSPVMSYPPNHLGIYDLGGNAWEWCQEFFEPGKDWKVIRGGCFLNFGPPRKSSWRLGAEHDFRRMPKDDYNRRMIGFRLVMETNQGSAGQKSAAPTSPATATKESPFINSLGMKFVPVPITGGPTDKQRVLFSVWETRVQDYAKFAKETKREWEAPNPEQVSTYPAVSMTWEDARAFCAWLTDCEHKVGKLAADQAYRLPADHEWSCAVGLGEREDPALPPLEKSGRIANVFPWGGGWPPQRGAGNYWGEEKRAADSRPDKMPIVGYRDGFVDTAPVGSFAANGLGLYDLGGNVWELCEATRRIVRGGSAHDQLEGKILSSYRGTNEGAFISSNAGFRIVLAPVTNKP